MKDEIKEILDRLERIDHKEYIAFEFADSASFDETARCFEERKKMANYITNLQEENEHLDKVNCHLRKNINSNIYKSRNEKAIKLLKEAGCYDEETKTFCDDVWEELPTLLKILEGDDKE